MQPIWLMQTDANRVLNQAGNLDLAHGGHIVTQPFIDNFVYMGDGGATIGLVLCIGYLVWRKRASKQNKVLAPLTIVPGLFNINELVVNYSIYDCANVKCDYHLLCNEPRLSSIM